jgi:hypothetical protein
MMNSILEPEYERIRRQAYSNGCRDTKERIEKSLMTWAVTHPDAVVRDELWQAVENVRKEQEAWMA